MFNYINNVIIAIEKIKRFLKHVYELIINIKYLFGPVEVSKDIYVRKRLFHHGYEILKCIDFDDTDMLDSKLIFEHVKYIKNLKEL